MRLGLPSPAPGEANQGPGGPVANQTAGAGAICREWIVHKRPADVLPFRRRDTSAPRPAKAPQPALAGDCQHEQTPEHRRTVVIASAEMALRRVYAEFDTLKEASSIVEWLHAKVHTDWVKR